MLNKGMQFAGIAGALAMLLAGGAGCTAKRPDYSTTAMRVEAAASRAEAAANKTESAARAAADAAARAEAAASKAEARFGQRMFKK